VLELRQWELYEEYIGLGAMALALFGGVLMTMGAIIYAIKKPNPWPGMFEYHELLHVLMILGIYCFEYCAEQIVSTYTLKHSS